MPKYYNPQVFPPPVPTVPQPKLKVTKDAEALRKAKGIGPVNPGVIGKILTGGRKALENPANELTGLVSPMAMAGLFPRFTRGQYVKAAMDTVDRSIAGPGGAAFKGVHRDIIAQMAKRFPRTVAHIDDIFGMGGAEGFTDHLGLGNYLRSKIGFGSQQLASEGGGLAKIGVGVDQSPANFRQVLHHEGDHVAQTILNPRLPLENSPYLSRMDELLAYRSELPRRLRRSGAVPDTFDRSVFDPSSFLLDNLADPELLAKVRAFRKTPFTWNPRSQHSPLPTPHPLDRAWMLEQLTQRR